MEWILIHVPTSVLVTLIVGVIFLFAIGLVVGRYVWLDRFRPASDSDHIRALLELNGARIEWIKPYGIVLGGRSGPHYRRYRVAVAETDGTETTDVIDVEAVMLGRPAVRKISQRNHPSFKDG